MATAVCLMLYEVCDISSVWCGGLMNIIIQFYTLTPHTIESIVKQLHRSFEERAKSEDTVANYPHRFISYFIVHFINDAENTMQKAITCRCNNVPNDRWRQWRVATMISHLVGASATSNLKTLVDFPMERVYSVYYYCCCHLHTRRRWMITFMIY